MVKWDAMSARKKDFANGEFFHIYNRGVDKRIIFLDAYDLERFFKSMLHFNSVDPVGSLYEISFNQLGGETPKSEKRLVNIVAYCLNPNHFHFILEQIVDGGISEFMKRLSGGYTSYFNNRNKRSGSLFQGVFKAIHIDSNEYLLHLSAYVNLNNHVHKLGGETPKLIESRSSWEEYTNERTNGICEKKIILEQFTHPSEYGEFARTSLETIIHRKEELKDIDNFLLE